MCSVHLFRGMLGCLGGMLLHLIVGSVYQWGIMNVYITSYFQTIQGSQSLSSNAIVFPVMMLGIGLTMRFGNYAASKIGTPYMAAVVVVLMSALVFASSYVKIFGVFVLLYGVLFGLLGGMLFTTVMAENNKYFKDKQMYVNGFILVGTGLGPVVFGLFSYSFINYEKATPIDGLYVAATLEYIAQRVPECIRFLSLIYLCIGITGSLLLLPVYFYNNRPIVSNNTPENQSSVNINLDLDITPAKNLDQEPEALPQIDMTAGPRVSQLQQTVNVLKQIRSNLPKQPVQYFQCPNLATAFGNRVTYLLALEIYLGAMGSLFVNNSYKTFVKSSISNDQFLTIIGALGSLVNGLVRFPWNFGFKKVGLKYIFMVFGIKNIILFCLINLTVYNQSLYCFMVVMCNVSLGGFFGIMPSQSLKLYGQKVGSDIYGFFWTVFVMANFTQYGLGTSVDLRTLFYVFAGLSGISAVLVWFIDLDIDWNKPEIGQEQIQMHAMPMHLEHQPENISH